MRCKKIVILGPESTGKSTLCEKLTDYFTASRPAAWIPEYAREYLEKNGTNYAYPDLLEIARGQVGLEEDAVAGLLSQRQISHPQPSGDPADHETYASTQAKLPAQMPAGFSVTAVSSQSGNTLGLEPVLFIDTDLYVMKVWSEFVYGQCDLWILDQLARRHYDGYLLCTPDLPWTYDVLREYPDEGPRQTLFHIYRDLMINQGTPWATIAGLEEARLAGAITAVEGFLGEPRG